MIRFSYEVSRFWYYTGPTTTTKRISGIYGSRVSPLGVLNGRCLLSSKGVLGSGEFLYCMIDYFSY